jgi:ankyrin repeat protein
VTFRKIFSSLFVISFLLASGCSCRKPIDRRGNLKKKSNSPLDSVTKQAPAVLKLTTPSNRLIDDKVFQLNLIPDGGQGSVIVADYVLQIKLEEAKDELGNPVANSGSIISYVDATNTPRAGSIFNNNLNHFTTKKELASSSSIDLSFTLTPAANTKEITLCAQLQRTGNPTIQTVKLVWKAAPSERLTDALLSDIRNLDPQDPTRIQQYKDLENAGGRDSRLALEAYRAENREEAKQALLDFLEKIKNGDSIVQDEKKAQLINACILGHLPTLQLLLDTFPEVDIKDPEGTDQNLLAFARNAAIAKLLLEKGLDPNYIPPGWEVPAFEQCAYEGNIDAIRCMVREGGADINQRKRRAAGSATITLQNISLIDTPTVLGLLELGADPNRIGKRDAQTILHCAARYSDCPLAVVQALLEKTHGLVNSQLTSTGDTALHIAAATGNTTMVELLLNKRAETSIRNKQNHTALQVAVLSNKPVTIKLLLKHPTNAQEIEEAKQLARDSNNQAILDLLNGNA